MSDAKPRYYVEPIPLSEEELKDILGDAPAKAAALVAQNRRNARVTSVNKHGSITGFEVLEDTP